MGRKLKLDAKNNASDQVFANFFKTELTDSFQFMSGIAADAEKILKQEMLINAIEDARTSQIAYGNGSIMAKNAV